MPDPQDAERFRAQSAADRGGDALHLPGWTVDDWAALLAHARELRLGAGEVLMRAGQAERCLYLVAEGGLEVRAGMPGEAFGSLTRERPGAVIGEISFFDGGARSATVWATAPTRLLQLDRDGVRGFSQQRPQRGHELLMALGRVLAWRVRRSEERRAAGA